MSTINHVKNKQITYTKGAVEILLKKCTKIQINNKIKPLTPSLRKEILQQNDTLASQALRVLGFSYGFEKKQTFIGLMGMIDPPRKHVKKAIELCKKAGIKVVMITGDHKLTARAIAEQIGLEHTCLTGDELNKLSDKELERKAKITSIYARVSPMHKVKILKALQKTHIVAMTGDGVNDAPALKSAEIGIAVGDSTDVTKQSSDMILLNNDFFSIVKAIQEGRQIYADIKKFVMYLLSTNFGEVLTIFLAILLGLPLPLVALQILWMNLVTDGFPALALGVEPGDKKMMHEPPRKITEKIIGKHALLTFMLIGLTMTIGTLIIFTQSLPKGTEYAETMAFTSLVLFQLINVFSFKNQDSIFKTKFSNNKKLILAVAVSIFLQMIVIYTPLGNIFGTIALSGKDWLKIVLVSLSGILVMELWKLFNKKIYKITD